MAVAAPYVLGNAVLSNGSLAVLAGNYTHVLLNGYSYYAFDQLQVAILPNSTPVTLNQSSGLSFPAGELPNRQVDDLAGSLGGGSIGALSGGGMAVVTFGGTNVNYDLQILNNSGAVTTSPFVIASQKTASNQSASNPFAAVVGTADGGFIVAYQQNNDTVLKYQHYNSSGSTVGSLVTVENVTGNQIGSDGWYGSMAVDLLGNTIFGLGAPNIYLQSSFKMYNSSGTVLNTSDHVVYNGIDYDNTYGSTTTSSYEAAPRFAPLSGGGFITAGFKPVGNYNSQTGHWDSFSVVIQQVSTSGAISTVDTFTNAIVNGSSNNYGVNWIVALPNGTIEFQGGLLAGTTNAYLYNPSTHGLSTVSIGSLPFEVYGTSGTPNNAIGVGVNGSNQLVAEGLSQVSDTAPTITSNSGGASASVNVAENTTAVTTVTATDPDNGQTLTYSISGGADQAKFSIDGSTGVLSFLSAPNFESPTDSGGNNVYDVTVQVSDGSLTDTQAIAVTVTNVNETPSITSNSGGPTASVNVAENTTGVTTVTATDPDAGTTLTYSISGGADQGKFSIGSSSGVLTFVSAPNFESPTDSGGNNVYDVTVQVSDGSLTDTQAIAVTVTNANEAPAITSNGGGASATVNVAENTTAVTTVTATDPDAGATQTYSISGGADQAKFSIDGSTGVLTFVSAPNFESPTDAGGNNVYDVTVQVSDGTLTDTQAIAVTVTNANEAPTITSNGGGASATVNVAENTTAVTTVTATDPDAGATQTYSISGGADQAKFSIDGSTGVLSFLSAPNFESPTDSGGNNVYDVTVQVSDGTLTDTQAIAVTVTNANEAPTITSNGGGASATVNVAENTTAVTTVTATDPDAGATQTYSISGGADQAKFSIDGSTGVLSFISAPNFESPTDAGGNNVYDVTVQVSDGTLTDTQAIAVTVTNANEAPTITSNGGGASATVNVAENTTAVTTVTATDPDAGATQTYSISGGADQAKFSIDGSTGVLSFLSAPNFESPTDSGGNNVYDVTVQVSDGTLTDTQAIAVTVTNANEAPTITSNGGGASATVNVAENTTAVTTVTATDPDAGTTQTYSISGGADQAKFSIDGSTGVLSFLSAPNFESPTDSGGNNVYDVTVQVSDGTLTDTQAIAVTVTNANEAPTITSNGGGASATVNVAENTTAVTTVTATDPDAGATQTYSISGGADQAKFSIDGSTGVLSFISAPNFESPTDAGGNNVYDVTVQVSDGTLTDTQAIAVTVTNVNEAPTAVALANTTASIAENTSTSSHIKVGDIVVTDDALGTDTLTLTGADAASFEIQGTSLFLKAGTVLDFETKDTYSVAVVVDDTSVGSTPDATSATYTLHVSDVVETISGDSGPNVVNGNRGADILLGLGGDDTLNGFASNDVLNGGAGFDILNGGSGPDIFVLDQAALTDAQAATPVFDEIVDYNQGNIGIYSAAEGDQIDLSAIVQTAFDGGQAANALVRLVSDPSNSFVLLQVDPDGTANGTHWTTVAKLDDLQSGDSVNVILDSAQSAGTAFSILTDAGHFGDFDHDGKADIVWRGDDGTFAVWQLTGSTVSSTQYTGVPNIWHNLGVGDFNGDSHADVLWLKDDGTLLDWQMTNSQQIGSLVGLGPVPTNSTLAGIGDVDGDGKSDLIWRDQTTHAITFNTMAGATATIDDVRQWAVVGVGDYDGDGKSDVMFRNLTTGDTAAWLMNGTTIKGAVFYQGTTSDWHVVGTGDFNGDGTSDLLWHDDNGANAVWLMDHTGNVQQTAFLAGTGSDWHVSGTGDFDGDHKDDVLWTNDNGATAIWVMNGGNAPTVEYPQGAPGWAATAHHYEFV